MQLSISTFINLERWANIHGKTVNYAAEHIIKQYLEHEEFYQAPKKKLNFYLSDTKISIYNMLRISGANLSQIAKKTGIRYTTVTRHIEDLVLAGIVTEHKYGKMPIRFFTLNHDNPLTKRILKTLDTWYKP